ncbi:TPA: hypothetical protein ACFU2V_001216 [Neisseria subflava]
MEVKLKAAKVYIENESWDRCFKRYDREHTFFYVDPPYWQTAGYDQSFDWEQYELLAKVKPVENWSYVIGKIKSDGSVAFLISHHPT